jgi:CubicO group peptidase (beta-lactamase class C family)
MTDLTSVLTTQVASGLVPGVVGLVARGDDVEVAALGSVDVEGSAPITRDAIFRLASLTKPITAAAAMILVGEGRIALDDPIARWLPELAAPMVVRTPGSELDDVLPAARPITLAHLLTFTAGYGFPSDFSLPAVAALFRIQSPMAPHLVAPPEEWMKQLAAIPMLGQPGDLWLYNTCSDILGVLISRIANQSLPDFFAERLFEPLGMVDTGFQVPAAQLHRLVSMYKPDPEGDGLLFDDHAVAEWSRLPAFPSGGGGLASTADDWLAFGRMLLSGGEYRGRRILSAESVRLMMTDHLTAAQRSASTLFLEGSGWGFGGSVDVPGGDEVWNTPGRYGWVGGTGTAGHVVPGIAGMPGKGTVAVLLTQVAMTSPVPPAVMREFWRYAAGG